MMAVTQEERIRDLEKQVATLTKSRTNSPKFWTRALAILGHQMAITGIFYGGIFLITLLVTLAES